MRPEGKRLLHGAKSILALGSVVIKGAGCCGVKSKVGLFVLINPLRVWVKVRTDRRCVLNHKNQKSYATEKGKSQLAAGSNHITEGSKGNTT